MQLLCRFWQYKIVLDPGEGYLHCGVLYEGKVD
jgi:hypothetical protein